MPANRARRRPPVRVGLAALVLAALARPAFAALEYPVILPDRDPITLPAFRGDMIEIQLGARAAAQARGTRAAFAADVAVTRLGVPRVDALAAAIGVRAFEPLFRAETTPAPGSGKTDFTAFYLAHLPPGTDLEDALARFRALPELLTVDPVAILPVSRLPDDSLFSVSTWLYQPPLRRDIQAPEAWDLTTGDSSIVIAILDTGVIPYHPDLGGAVAGYAGNIWTHAAEAGGVAGVDDDGNGYVDDVHGWDFVNTTAFDVPAAEDTRVEDPDPNDYAGHGTAVAGLAAARFDNAIGVAGVAGGARIMPLRVAYAYNADTLGGIEMPFVARALRYAARMGAHVINCSFATRDEAGLYAAATEAIESGALIVCAAGNDPQPHELADREDVLAVAATDAADRIPSYSNRGDFVDLAAPGGPVFSTFVTRTRADSVGRRQPTYHTGTLLTGTSFSAPLVAGAAALVQSRRRALGVPLLSPYELILKLFETADDIAAENPGVTGYGNGRLNAYRALTAPGLSTAFRVGGRTVGAGVVLDLPSGARRQVHAIDRGRLVFVDGRSDVVATATLPAPPIGDPAAADLGMGRGPAVFVAMTGGRLDSYDASAARRAGWPVALPGLGGQFVTGPALGDLDADGRLEVVACSADGKVWAWHADGSVVAGFPVNVMAAASAGVALADLDGVPGAEIVVATSGFELYVLRGNGSALAGWPVYPPDAMRSPVVTRFAPGGPPRVIVAGGPWVQAYGPDGALVLNAGLPGPAAQDPALGDLDGDGVDEIVVATRSPARLAVFDTSGAALSGLGWPHALAFESTGPPLVAQLREADPGARPEVLATDGNRPIALTNAATRLPLFPRPGRAGRKSSVVTLDATGTSLVLAGTNGSDSVLYVYDAGPASAAGDPSPWPTSRCGFARTGNRLDPPGRPHALRRASGGARSITLAWIAPGDDGPAGRPAAYRVRVATDASFSGARDTTIASAAPVGAEERLAISRLEPATAYWFSVRASDVWGEVSLESEPLEAATGPGGPVDGRSGLAIAPLARPSRIPVALYWQAPDRPAGGEAIAIYDAAGRRLVTLRLDGSPAGVAQWNGRDGRGASVPAGLYFARLVSGSLHTQTRVVLLP